MDRSLEALGLDDVPAELPLTYPGRPATRPSLLLGDELLPLDVRATRLGEWTVDGRGRLDEVLTARGQETTGRRHPVIAVGSNAAPGQVRHKLRRLNLPVAVPMVPVRVRGIGVGCSGHISPAGYVAGTPYVDPDGSATLVIAWFDARQLTAVDDTEPNYLRAILPGDTFEMIMPSGERLGGASLYFSAHGVLAVDGKRPLPGGGDQAELLSGLLSRSSRLRELLGPDPVSWVGSAGADQAVRARGTGIFREEGWVLPRTDFLPYLDDSAEPRLYDDLPPLADSLPPQAGNV
ncbi:hypothetical protein [Streptomyces vilmorinianum]|uniref:hypothetical protein n=1 Tax=Streptomyces vilmorinianum TaxID=3051092 RepID=UPI0020C77DF7|nr:hypothetical protein [Streptomyces vilmorinianum]